MTADDTLRSAIETLGEGKSDDYVISPASHARELKDKAPGLAAILRSSAVITTAEEFEREDQDALAAQKEFKRIFDRSNFSVLATGTLVALIMATAALDSVLPEGAGKPLLVILSLGGIISGALASMDILTIRQGGLLETWMSKRASAESLRLDYFDRIVKVSEQGATESDPSAKLLQLEYFRRYQLDIQLSYYRERSKDHREEAKRTLAYSGWAVLGAAIATGSAGVLGAAVDISFAAVGALAAVFTGLSSFASMREAVHQNRRNAERQERTRQVLTQLKKRLDEVRQAVYAEGLQPLSDFVDAVHEQISLEHRQWLGDLGEARGAFAKLDKTLKEASARIPQKPGTTGGS